MIELKCATKNYDWGKTGLNSYVAQLLVSSGDSTILESLQKNIPFAELWMGTHASGPSVLASTGQTLSSWLADHPEALGDKVIEQFGSKSELPFLFKVLSVNKALSIQAHPNKKHAEQLFKEHPNLYPDANHKPELAVALTQFEALCGFRPRSEIVDFFLHVSELQQVVDLKQVTKLVEASGDGEVEQCMCQCFTALMTAPEAQVKQCLQALVTRIETLKGEGQDTGSMLGDLLLRLYYDYPGDVGCLAIYFLNHVTLQPGQAIFLAANVPHAYLCGDCIEIMACSDNVVRAGLTPKFKDVATLCAMLDYHGKSAEDNKFLPLTDDPRISVFNPPVPDFTLARIEVPANEQKYKLRAVDSGSVLLVLSGTAKVLSAHSGENTPPTLSAGHVIFVPANQDMTLNITSSETLDMFQAYCEL